MLSLGIKMASNLGQLGMKKRKILATLYLVPQENQ